MRLWCPLLKEPLLPLSPPCSIPLPCVIFSIVLTTIWTCPVFFHWCEHCSRSRTSSGLFSGLLLEWETGLVMCGAQNVRTVLSVIIYWLLSPHLSPLFLMFILQSPIQDPTTTETRISWLEVSPWPWHMSPQLLPYWFHKLFDVRVHFLWTQQHILLSLFVCACHKINTWEK